MPTSPTTTSFPTTVDNFPVYEDGTGGNSILRAEIWNNRQLALTTLQGFSQQLIHVAGGTDLKRLILTATAVATGSALTVVGSVALTAAQVQFLGSQPFRPGNQLQISAFRSDGSQPVIANAAANEGTNTISFTLQHLDPTLNLTAATYQVALTLLGS